MPVVKLIVEYDGTRYVGWQVQPNGPSIQAELERALATLRKVEGRVTAAGRTDAGVHARGQVVSFPEERPLPLTAYVKGMNALLPEDVAVRAASVEPDGFDARRSALGKRYVYTIEQLETRAPLTRRRAWQLFGRLDVAAMRAGAEHLVGRHDFAAFQAADCASEHAVRDVRRLELVEAASGRIEIFVEATAFVKHMIRNFVGTLVEVGQGRREPAWVAEVLASKDRTRAGRTAPPQGLCLDEVFYGVNASRG
ncbi:MAG: tRNA pseudouridine(38-40) synthase TruA [Anaeromyxobacteraceae bacterium]